MKKKRFTFRFGFGISCLAIGVLGLIQELHKGVFLIFDTSIFSILIGIYLFLSTFFQRKENNYSQ
jgi:ABC-type proline/glycine betaine transport system permease subunit